MSSKKYKKSAKSSPQTTQQHASQHSPGKVWLVRIVVILLCVAVAITLIPSVFF